MNQSQPIVLSVSDFVDLTNQTLEYAYTSILVEGEVSSFKVNQGKFVFFDLKDADATVSCFMMLFQMRMPLADGMKVLVRATPKLTKWGKFSLTVTNIQPVGEGNIKKSLDLIREKLAKEGLFAVKRPLPYDITRIAVISSVGAAGYKDFIKIINERWAGLSIDVAHVQVQGIGAADQVIKALKYFNEKSDHDVIAIVRGGGSADDLATFSDELLAREIAASKIVTITGIGHEVDESLADLAADVRASTPSNAAQMLTRDKANELQNVHSVINDITQTVCDRIDYEQAAVHQRARDVEWTIDMQVKSISDKLVSHLQLLEQLNPETVLKNGYALLKGVVKIGNVVNITTYKNVIQAEVQNVKKR